MAKKKKKDDHVIDSIDESKCADCLQTFGFLAEIDGKFICFDCFVAQYGSTKAMELTEGMSSWKFNEWSTPKNKDELMMAKMGEKYDDDKIQRLFDNIITNGIDVTALELGRGMCQQGICSGDTRLINFEDEDIKGMLLENIGAYMKIKSEVKGDVLQDKELFEFLQSEINNIVELIVESGYSYIKYLTILFTHFKHTAQEKMALGSFQTAKVYDIENNKVIPCSFTDDDNELDEKTSRDVLFHCKSLLVKYFNKKKSASYINSFELEYKPDEAEDNLFSIMSENHFDSPKEHKRIQYLKKPQLEFLEKNEYPLNWDKLHETNGTVLYCRGCKFGFGMKDPTFNETVDEHQAVQEEKVKKIMKEKPKYLPVAEAIRALARRGIKSQNALKKAKAKNHVKDIPKNPVEYYAGTFKWIDVVKSSGRKKKVITIDNVEKALLMLKDNWNLYMRKPEGFFYVWFDSWGLFEAKDPFKQRFFTEFINLKQSVEGRRELFEAISTGRFDMVKGHYPTDKPKSNALAKTIPLSNDITNTDEIKLEQLLQEDKEAGVSLILQETEQLLPMDVNSKAFQLHVRITVQELWISVMRNGEKEYSKIASWKNLHKNKNVLTKTVIDRFLNEYSAVFDLWNKLNASLYRGEKPNIMQLYVAYKITKQNGFCNFTSTGVGKTKSAVIGSRVTKSNRVLVLCPSNILQQWGKFITNDYPDSYISYSTKSKDPVFPATPSKGDYRYHIVNYEKFGRQETVEDLMDRIAETKVKMVIIDEAQWVKQRDDENISNRRRNLEILLSRLRSNNRNLKVLFLTATPIINNITEGLRLLEMVSNKRFPHIKTANKIRNASRLYMEFLEYSLRFKKEYGIKEKHTEITTHTKIPIRIPADDIREFNYSDWEILCTPDRIPEMVDIVRNNGRTIIYTEYVTKVIDKIKEAFEDNGLTVGLYTGTDKTGLRKPTEVKGEYTNPFQNGDIDVLIASSPIAEGIDGLQDVCNNLIFNGLPWTYAKFEQIIGRLVRTGQTQDVNVFTILSEIENYPYDRKIKLDRLFQKEMLQMCVLDGKIPNIEKWNENTTKTNKMFVNTVLRNRESRIASKKEIRKSGLIKK
jgi:superfamily II DNA or RNA helicase